MERNFVLQPFLKWAGGKRQLLPEIFKFKPNEYKTYYEPFLGAGAVLFSLKPSCAVVNDINSELINCYEVIKDSLDDLLQELRLHYENHLNKENDSKEYYYSIRQIDRKPENYAKLTKPQKAARMIYLNKTCFNGLFRVNSKGQFNVPYGNHKCPNIINEEVLKGVSEYLNQNDIVFNSVGFEQAVADAQANDFIYFDPPYDPISSTSQFTNYANDNFGKSEQRLLRRAFYELHMRGCKLMLSNSSTDFILDLYSEPCEEEEDIREIAKWRIEKVSVSRNINSIANGRGKIEEVLIVNY